MTVQLTFVEAVALVERVALTWSHPAAQLARDLHNAMTDAQQAEHRQLWRRLGCKLRQSGPCGCGQHDWTN